ncbi:MAG: hypothetical protein M0Z66_10475 [Thermaerobacter sp.]|nr:hypothetical protein [Thermaerobacter sp.]
MIRVRPVRAIVQQVLSGRRAWAGPLAIGVLGGLWWLAIGGVAYLTGHAGAYDFGYYMEAMRTIAGGALNPTPAALPGHTYLADNIALYSYPVALLFRIWPSSWLLIAMQATWFGAVVAMVVRYAQIIGLRGWTLTVLAQAHK